MRYINEGKHFGKGSSMPDLPNDGRVRLYAMKFCPYAHRANLILKAKNIDYHIININLVDKPEWLLEKSPLGKVPALELVNEPDSPTLVESLIVADYLDEKYNTVNPLHPKDPAQKALDRILVERFSAVGMAMFEAYTSQTKPNTLSRIYDGLDIFEKELHKRETIFFGGDKPSMLDFMIWPWMERSEMIKYTISDPFEINSERYPKLVEWCQHMKNNDAVKAFYISGENHAKFFKMAYGGGGPVDYDFAL